MRSAKLARALIHSLQTSSAASPAESPSIQSLLQLSQPPSGPPGVASNSLLTHDSASLFSQTRKHSAKADPIEHHDASAKSTADAEASTPSGAATDFESMQKVLSQFVPSEEMNAIYHSNDEDSDPVYDLPNWLEHNYPQHDTQPRSPLYHWVSWMHKNIPMQQQRLYLALDQYMQSEEHRKALVAQANYELARLWDWQHRRVAAGLSPELGDEELVAIKRRVADQKATRKASESTRKAATNGDGEPAHNASKSLEDVLKEGLKEQDAKAIASVPLPSTLSIIELCVGGGIEGSGGQGDSTCDPAKYMEKGLKEQDAEAIASVPPPINVLEEGLKEQDAEAMASVPLPNNVLEEGLKEQDAEAIASVAPAN
eukprot:gene28506-31663_t